MPRPDEGLIHAWLDGELEAAEAARVEQLVAEDAEWASAAAEARGLIAASTRILGALDVVAGDVIPQGGSAASAVAPRRAMPTWMKLAASVVLVAGLSYVGLREDEVALVATEPIAALERAADPVAEPAPAPPVAVPPAPRRTTVPAAAGAVANALIAKASDAAPPAPSPARSELSAGDARDAAAASVRGVAGGTASAVVRPAAPVVPSSAGATVEQESRLAAGAPTAARPRARSSAPVAAPIAQSAALADAPSAKLAQEMIIARTLAGCWRTVSTARVDSLQVDPSIIETVGDTLVLVLKPEGATGFVTRIGADRLRGRVRDATGTIAPLTAVRLTACGPQVPGG